MSSTCSSPSPPPHPSHFSNSVSTSSFSLLPSLLLLLPSPVTLNSDFSIYSSSFCSLFTFFSFFFFSYLSLPPFFPSPPLFHFPSLPSAYSYFFFILPSFSSCSFFYLSFSAFPFFLLFPSIITYSLPSLPPPFPPVLLPAVDWSPQRCTTGNEGSLYASMKFNLRCE